MKIAIIPARAGSKRVKQKNIRPFAGEPMIQHPIRAALESKLFDRVIVSTESAEIAAIARKAGAEVPFVRPEELAGDLPSSIEVMVHALNWLKSQGCCPELACMIYATSAFLTPEYLKQGLELLEKLNADSSAAVVAYPHPIDRAFLIDESRMLKFRWPENQNVRTNDLPPSYHDLGMFYWLRVEKFLETKTVWQARTTAVVLPQNCAQDVDTEEDWANAERLFQSLRNKR